MDYTVILRCFYVFFCYFSVKAEISLLISVFYENNFCASYNLRLNFSSKKPSKNWQKSKLPPK